MRRGLDLASSLTRVPEHTHDRTNRTPLVAHCLDEAYSYLRDAYDRLGEQPARDRRRGLVGGGGLVRNVLIFHVGLRGRRGWLRRTRAGLRYGRYGREGTPADVRSNPERLPR